MRSGAGSGEGLSTRGLASQRPFDPGVMIAATERLDRAWLSERQYRRRPASPQALSCQNAPPRLAPFTTPFAQRRARRATSRACRFFSPNPLRFDETSTSAVSSPSRTAARRLPHSASARASSARRSDRASSSAVSSIGFASDGTPQHYTDHKPEVNGRPVGVGTCQTTTCRRSLRAWARGG